MKIRGLRVLLCEGRRTGLKQQAKEEMRQRGDDVRMAMIGFGVHGRE
jgi:hypothetical protein